MVAVLFDRVAERGRIDRFCAGLSPASVQVLWLEGEPGVGKTVLMEYALSQLTARGVVLRYEDGRQYHKCNVTDQDTSFSMISSPLATLESMQREHFAASVSSYMNRYSGLSLRESLFLALPAIRGLEWLRPLLDKEQQRRKQVHDSISQHVLEHHLLSLSVDLLTDTLPRTFHGNMFVLAIDDIAWIDLVSFRIIVATIHRLRRRGLSLSLVVTSRDYESVENKDWFTTLERQLSELSDDMTTLSIDNLDRRATVEYLNFCERSELESRSDFIFNRTNGNPQQLFQLIKLSLPRLERLYDASREDAPDSAPDVAAELFSRERVHEIMTARFDYLVVLCILSALRNNVELQELIYLSSSVGRRVGRHIWTKDDIENTIEKLETLGLAHRAGAFFVCHDSLLPHIESVARILGEHNAVWDAIVDALENTARLPLGFDTPRHITQAITVAVGNNPSRAKALFLTYYPVFRERECIPVTLLIAGCMALLRAKSVIEPAITNDIIVDLIRRLNLAAKYEYALSLADLVFDHLDTLATNERFSYLHAYVTSLRECNALEREEPTTIAMIINLLESSAQESPYLSVQASLVKCSALEHLGKFDEIRTIYASLDELISDISDEQDRLHARAVYCRNAGLALDHHLAIPKYEEAIRCAQLLRDRSEHERQVLIGTAQNNLGIGYIYSGHLRDAEDALRSSIDILYSTHYGSECPYNNLAVCALLRRDPETALELFERSRELFSGGPYQDVVIDVNLSVALWKMGYHEKALALITPIADGTERRRLVTVEVVRARAAMTCAYYHMEAGRYWEAARYYDQSRLPYFRLYNEQEQQRRTTLVNYCLARAQAKEGLDIGDLSIVDDSNTDLLRRPYDLMVLALYIN